jgi:3-oxoacyl-[acyl-carrier protein] reductase
MFDLSEKTALVTGASGGIGTAIARVLHGQGARTALSGTRTDQLEKLAAELGDGRAFPVPCNLAVPAEVDGLIAKAEAVSGAPVDILVNNAGITRDNLFMRMKDEDWEQVVAVNLTAPFKLCRAVLRHMVRRRWGRIITVTSVVGSTGNPGQANYAAAKAGLVGMTKALAAEVAARNITVNCVAPGFIATSMTDVLTPEQKAQILPRIPIGCVGEPSDVAGAVLYLASEEARYVTGATLHVNGGMAML